jgi:hypothetical protein
MRGTVSNISVHRNIGSPPAEDTIDSTYSQSVSQSAGGADSAVAALAVFYLLPSPAALGCDPTPMGDRRDLKLGPLTTCSRLGVISCASCCSPSHPFLSVSFRSNTVMTF